jgi:hypothetical protein
MRPIRLMTAAVLACALALALFVASDTSARSDAPVACRLASRSCAGACPPCPACPGAPRTVRAETAPLHQSPALIPHAFVY